MNNIKIQGGFTCPHCYKLNLCTCETCKTFYDKNGIGDMKYCQWSEDGNHLICSYCNTGFSLDSSLDAEYELLKTNK